jgi:DNA invertase Pin-like site-specific DNA recombinase
MKVDSWIKINASSKRTTTERRIDELLEKVKQGDTIIVAELSRLARSVGQIAIIVDQLIKNKVRLIAIKENIDLNGKHTIQTKTMLTMFSLFAEIERDLISERTKEEDIRYYLSKRLNIGNIAKIFDVTWPTMNNFIKSRKIKV